MIDAFFLNLPTLVVALPLLIAPILAFMGGKADSTRWLAWLLTFATAGLVFSSSFFILIDVIRNGATSYHFGNWAAPIGIEYKITGLNALLMLLISGLSFVLLPFALDSIEKEIPKEKTPLFYSCFLLCLSGLLGMVLTNDLFNIFVFLEISSITIYAMIAMGRGNASLTAAFHYLITGTVGATFYLTGVAFLYVMTGSLNFSDIAQILANQGEASMPVLAAFAMIIIGLCIKSGVVPLASWLVRSYANSPSFVSAFLAGTATKVSLLILVKILFLLFGMEVSFNAIGIDSVFIVLAIIAMLYGSISALYQTNVKRMLAFSSLSNIGYIIFAISTLGELGLIAAIFHIISHSIAKSGLFACTGIVQYQTGGSDIENFKGMGKKSPITMACFLIFGLSMVGVPLTSGFVGKWYLLSAAIESDYAALIIATLVTSSVLTFLYIWKIIDVAYSGNAKAKTEATPQYMNISVITLAIITLALGLMGAPVIRYIAEISKGVLQ